jgi:hypothetical protein
LHALCWVDAERAIEVLVGYTDRQRNLIKSAKGSRKNKFAFSSVEALAWQGAKASQKHNGNFDRDINIFQAFATQPGRMHGRFKM